MTRRHWLPLIALFTVTLFSFCTDEDSANAMNYPIDDNEGNIHGKVLVAYFSRANYVPEGTDGVTGATNKAGNTQTVAAYINEQTKGTLFEVVPERDYPVSHTECSAIAQEEWRNNERPALRTHLENMDDYSVVFVGFPIWVYREPAAVLTFLEEYDFSGKTVIPFCTSMAVGVEQSTADFKETLPNSDVREGLRIGYTLPDGWQEDVNEWLGCLKINNSNNGDNQNTEMKVKITVNGRSLTATFFDNVTAKAFLEKLPCTLPMMDLYGREMCYRFPDALPTDNAYTQGYEVGEIVYYPPMHSFVIMYRQNGERFQMQKIGRVDSGVEVFDGIGDVDVSFEREGASSVSAVEADLSAISVKGGKVEVKASGRIHASVYNLSGGLIACGNGDNGCTIDCGGYKGIALVRLTVDNRSVSTKIHID